MSRVAGLLLLALVATVLSISGCGDDGSEGGVAGGAEASPAAIARADANCRYFQRQIHKIGKGALRGPGNIPKLATENLVKPSIPLLERVARRQQAVARESHDPGIQLYADFFNPIIVLAQRRLRLGRLAEKPGDTEDLVRAREVEELLSQLGLEQRQAAHEAGLAACDLDFQHELLTSLTA